jgi:hypothetical protein
MFILLTAKAAARLEKSIPAKMQSGIANSSNAKQIFFPN